MFVPVFDQDGKTPLMPTTPGRARRWIKSSKATGFWKKGVYCVRLNQIPSDTKKQEVVVGVDPGSKKEGYTVASTAHTYLNIQADAITWVKDKVEARRNARRARRFRNTPCRRPRFNRAKGGLSPSTKARWQWKLRLLNYLDSLFPVAKVVVEDIAASTKKYGRRWNSTFSPLQVGKHWFYTEIRKKWQLYTKSGWQTKEIRCILGLKKSSKKMANKFSAHCVDSFCLATTQTGSLKPDNTRLLCITPLQFHRRQLHVFQFAKGGKRRSYGGTLSHGFKRGSLVQHIKYGLCYVGGMLKDRVCLHDRLSGKRLCQNAKIKDLKILTNNKWKVQIAYRLLFFLPWLNRRGVQNNEIS